jgi:hypothetical protein
VGRASRDRQGWLVVGPLDFLYHARREQLRK